MRRVYMGCEQDYFFLGLLRCMFMPNYICNKKEIRKK